MNKDLIEGSIKDAAGKAQQKIGEIVGNPKQQVKGCSGTLILAT
ncbi:CsbD family protein [Shewanella sp. SACH]|nr:CsbD family protein [Shewanella sp. SACH]